MLYGEHKKFRKGFERLAEKHGYGFVKEADEEGRELKKVLSKKRRY